MVAIVIHCHCKIEDSTVNHLDSSLLYRLLDVCAMSLLLGACIFTGSFEVLRDSVARALPLWSTSSPLYAYVLSL